MTPPLCGCQPCRRAGRGTVQRNTHPAGLLPLRAGLSRCPGCGTGKPVSARTSGALLPAPHLHPLPGPGGQCAGRLGCAGRTGPGQGGQLPGLFPSYAYLRQVYEDFTARYPDIGTLAQESGLDDAARAAFLEQFGPSPAKTLLGFGVMGGIFGEGVDLVGDRLIGCAIVGWACLR